MKRLLFATLALIILAGVTFWTLGQKPEIGPEVLKKMKLVSRFKETLPAAEAGDPDAQYKIATMYQIGDGVKKDPKKTLEWLMKAAEQGHAPSRYQLGWMYANGIVVRQDYFMAAKYYRLAATFNNNTDAQFRLGELHFNGRGVEHDYGKAIKYYNLAAKKGHCAAQYILSSMYEEGWGVNRDLVMAYAWLKLATGKRAACLEINKKFDPVLNVKRLLPKMNKFQIDQGKKRALVLEKPR